MILTLLLGVSALKDFERTGNMDYIRHRLEFNDRLKYCHGNSKREKMDRGRYRVKKCRCKLVSKA